MSPAQAAAALSAPVNELGAAFMMDKTGVVELDRTVELVERVVDGAEPAGLPLFAAWRRVERARFFEWPEPYPDPAAHRARWDAAEDLTAAAAGRLYDALNARERAELVGLVTAAHTAAFG